VNVQDVWARWITKRSSNNNNRIEPEWVSVCVCVCVCVKLPLWDGLLVLSSRSVMWARLLLNCGFCCAWLLCAILSSPLTQIHRYHTHARIHTYIHMYVSEIFDALLLFIVWLLCYKNICITINAIQLQNDIYGNLFFNLPTLRRRNRNKLDNKRVTESNNNNNNNSKNNMAFIFTIRNSRYSNNKCTTNTCIHIGNIHTYIHVV